MFLDGYRDYLGSHGLPPLELEQQWKEVDKCTHLLICTSKVVLSFPPSSICMQSYRNYGNKFPKLTKPLAFPSNRSRGLRNMERAITKGSTKV